MKILLTGFTAFGQEATNPSWDLINQSDLGKFAAEIQTLEIETVYRKSRDILEDKLLEFKPDLVLLFGQAGGRTAISVERIAINVNDSRAADNSGEILTDEVIFADGPAAYFSTLDYKEIVNTLRTAKIPAYVSDTAGTYVCNNLFYTLMYLSDKHDLPISGGFIHVPFEHGQVLGRSNQPSMSLDTMTHACELIIEYYLNKEDVNV